MTRANIKFKPAARSAFSADLKARVADYFRQTHQTRHANRAMVIKICTIMTLFIASYGLLLSNFLGLFGMLLSYMVFGFSMVLIAFNIAHDASHHALFKRPALNTLFSYTFNLIGVNSYIWDIKHNRSHHAFTNVPGHDMDIEQIRIARLIDKVPAKWYYRYQHLYVPVLYPLASLYMILVKDFQMFATRQFGNTLHFSHPAREYVILILSKLLYLTYALLIPMWVLDLPWYHVMMGFLLMHAVVGASIAVILFPVHTQADSIFPTPDAEGYIHDDWYAHQIKTGLNFGARQPVLTWLSGGLNLHIPHHLFPGICHIHYEKLNGILKQTALEHGLPYKEITLFQVLRSHLQFLRIMGKATAGINGSGSNGEW